MTIVARSPARTAMVETVAVDFGGIAIDVVGEATDSVGGMV